MLILDEPTQGVDVGSKSEIHQMMVDLAEQGMAMIMISSELPEILGMSDRIAVMHAGTIAGVLSRAEATQETDSRTRAGARMMQALQRREISLVVAILAVVAVLAVAAPRFFTFANQRDLVLANMPVLIVALGMVLVILTGQIDISVGSQFAICSVAAGVFAQLGLPTPAGGRGGVPRRARRWARSTARWWRRCGIPSIVVTLATMVALRDGLRWVTQGAWVQDLPPDFQWFGQSQTASEIITIVLRGRADRGNGLGPPQPGGGAGGVCHRFRRECGAADGHRSRRAWSSRSSSSPARSPVSPRCSTRCASIRSPAMPAWGWN